MNIETNSILSKWILFTLMNDQGMKVKILNYGGIITEIVVPAQDGNFENVVLGYKNYEDYETNPNFLGAITGPVAGRIQGALFELDEEKYPLEINDAENHLHGGSNGFHQVIWNSETFQTEDTVGVKLTYLRPDGEGGYPGNLDVTVTYTLNNKNELSIQYEAETDRTTPVAITNHSYFNLSGDLKDTIENHIVTIDSDEFVELDQNLIPTGKLIDVTGTTFDFREGQKIAEGIHSDYEQNKIASEGYDHYFIFNEREPENVIVKDESSGRILTVKTDEQGMVMYTSNALDEGLELKEALSKPYLGICLETQGSPASLHHEGFPNIILTPNEKYRKETIFTFTVNN